MSAKRKPLGWAKAVIGKKLARRQLLGSEEMKRALDEFWQARPKEVGDRLRTWTKNKEKQ